MTTQYIAPQLSIFKDLEDLKSPNASSFFFPSQSRSSIEDLHDKKRMFVVSEPGFGKTRLLHEYLKNTKKPSVYIDLKTIGTNISLKFEANAEAFLKFETKTANQVNYVLNDFYLPNIPKLYCFDALDEVASDNMSQLISSISDFINHHPDDQFVISCRMNYLDKYCKGFASDFEFCEIKEFSPYDVHQYLLSTIDDKKNVDMLIDKMGEIIKVPRYLELIATLSKSESIDTLCNLSRGQLFDKCINHKLEVEATKNTSSDNKKYLMKKVLEKMALIMEIKQTNELHKNDFFEILDNIQSNIATSLLQQVNLDYFFKRSLLKNNDETIVFENTEFQEYLASKEIFNLGRTDQVVFDLVAISELHEIYPVWMNTLQFVIEQDIRLLRITLKYLLSDKNRRIDSSTFRLLTIYGVQNISHDARAEIFTLVYTYYQTQKIDIEYNIAERLSYYVSDDWVNSLTISDEQVTIEKRNIVLIIAYIIRNENVFDDQKGICKRLMLSQINTTEKDIRTAVIFALRGFNDISLFSDDIVHNIMQSDDSTAKSALMQSFLDIAPDHTRTIQLVVEGVQKRILGAKTAAESHKSKELYLALLQMFCDKNISLYDIRQYYLDIRAFIPNLLAHDIARDDVSRDLLKRFIKVNLNGFCSENDFLIQLIAEVHKYEPSYYEDNITDLFNLPLPLFCRISETYLQVENVERLIRQHSEVSNYRHYFGQAILSIRDNDRLNHSSKFRRFIEILLLRNNYRANFSKIFEIAKPLLKSEFDRYEAQNAEYLSHLTNDREQEKQKRYTEFKRLLNFGSDEYYPSLFNHFAENFDLLLSCISHEEKECLHLRIYSLFESVNPAELTMQITKRDSLSRCSLQSNDIALFREALHLAQKLELPIDTYRSKIIDSLIFAPNEYFDIIETFIGGLSAEDIEGLVVDMIQRNDDMVELNLNNCFLLLERNSTPSSIVLLKNIVSNTNIYTHDRIRALSLLQQKNEPKQYFIDIFSNNEKVDIEFAEAVNLILITRFRDTEAVVWRIDKTKSKKVKHKDTSRINLNTLPRNSVFEDESPSVFQLKMFVDCLQYPDDHTLFDNYTQLLDFACDSYEEHVDYHYYADLLFRAIAHYIINLKKNNSYHPAIKFEQKISTHITKRCYPTLQYWMVQIKREYALYLGQNQTLADCIKLYNKFKSTIYQTIATEWDLRCLVINIIEKDVRNWVENEGAYHFIRGYRMVGAKKSTTEDLMQKTLKTQLENGLLRAGLRKDEITINRESQLLNNIRPDFILSYGFIGPIIIEIKRVSNEQITDPIKRCGYTETLHKYLSGTGAKYGIYLVFQDDEKNTLEIHLPILKEQYKDDVSIEVIGINCIQS